MNMRFNLNSRRGEPRQPRARRFLVEALEGRTLLSGSTFTVDPFRSFLTLSGDAGNGVAQVQLMPQGTGNFNQLSSLTTAVGGTISADVNNGAITFLPDTQLTAQINGSWQPGSNPDPTGANPGNADLREPADFGGVGSFFGLVEYAAVRDLVAQLTSPAITVNSDGSFAPAGMLSFTTTQGHVYADGSQPDTIDLTGQAAMDQAGGPATYAPSNGVPTLMIPISVTQSFSGDNITANLTFTGQIVASAQVMAPPPNLLGTAFGDSASNGVLANTTQRSEVREIALTFDHAVMLGAGAVALSAFSGPSNTDPITDASAALGTPTSPDNGVTWIVPILPNTAFSDKTASLKDGVYRLMVVASKVTDSANNTLNGGDQSINFFRLFGDFNGDGKVNNADYFQFNKTFGKNGGQSGFVGFFDFNGDGQINNSDYFQFNKNFGKSFQLIGSQARLS